MGLKIVVCVKQVPETTEVKIDPETHTLIREGIPNIVNPFDEIAVEEAIRIKEKHGGEVIVVTMGPPQAREALLKCLAMGADRAIHISDRVFAGADTYATSYTLARVISQLDYDLIICGKQATDGDTAQVGPELAEHLGIPQITYAKKVMVYPGEKKIVVHRETDTGYEVVEAKLPVLITAIKGLNEPRIPSLMGIMAARKKEIKLVTFKDIGGSEDSYGLRGSPTWVIDVFTPEKKRQGIIIQGDDPETAAKKLVEFILSKGVVG